MGLCSESRMHGDMINFAYFILLLLITIVIIDVDFIIKSLNISTELVQYDNVDPLRWSYDKNKFIKTISFVEGDSDHIKLT